MWTALSASPKKKNKQKQMKHPWREAQRQAPSENQKEAFCVSWSRDQLSVNMKHENSVLLKTFVHASWKSTLKLGNL